MNPDDFHDGESLATARNSGDLFDNAVKNERAELRGRELDVRVLRLPDVRRMTGLCRSSIYQMEAERRFPRRVQIGARAVGWIESEVQDWLWQRIDSGRAREGATP